MKKTAICLISSSAIAFALVAQAHIAGSYSQSTPQSVLEYSEKIPLNNAIQVWASDCGGSYVNQCFEDQVQAAELNYLYTAEGLFWAVANSHESGSAWQVTHCNISTWDEDTCNVMYAQDYFHNMGRGYHLWNETTIAPY